MRALVVLCALCAAANAEPQLGLRIEGNEIHARVRGATLAEPVRLFGESQPAIDATAVRDFADAGPVGIVFVVEAQETTFGLWNHNEWQPDVDIFAPYVEAFSRLGLGNALPPGSEALLVTYATGAEIRAPWQPATSFGGDALGKRTDYRGRLGLDLLAGLQLAVHELEAKPFGRKIVFVLGDGNDANNEAAQATLVAMAREHADVMFVALIIKSAVSPVGNVISLLTPHHRVANPPGIEAAMKKLLEQATQQFDATFDLTKFERDGAEHRYTLVAGGDDIAHASLTMPKPPPPPPPSTLWRWFVVGAVVSAVALLLILRSKEPR